MQRRLKKITKTIWYEDAPWKVVKIYRPTKFDVYILCRRDGPCVHEDGTDEVQMVLLDAGNDVFYPDTRRVRKMILAKEDLATKSKTLQKDLEDFWLDVVMNDSY